MHLQARLLLCAVVVWLAVVGTEARPSSPTSGEEAHPLRRDARETTGFHTAHQDAGITKLLDTQYESWNTPAFLIPLHKELFSHYGYNIFLPLRHQTTPVSYQHQVMLPSVRRSSTDSVHSRGVNSYSTSHLAQYYSRSGTVRPNIFSALTLGDSENHTNTLKVTSQKVVSRQESQKDDQLPRVDETKRSQAGEEEVETSDENEHDRVHHETPATPSVLEQQSKLKTASSAHDEPSPVTISDDSTDEAGGPGFSGETITDRQSDSEEASVAIFEMGGSDMEESSTAEDKTASLVRLALNSARDNTTTLILAPRAKSVAGKKGVAIAAPVSNAVVNKGQRVKIHFLPDAVAIAGPGGIADAHSDLYVTFVDQ